MSVRHNISIDPEFEEIINKIISEKAGVKTVSGAIEWALKKADIFLRFPESKIHKIIVEAIETDKILQICIQEDENISDDVKKRSDRYKL
jgi:hypothetical protein